VGPVAVIGDVHGRIDHLDRLLARLPAEARIVVAGDVCDRGPATREVIERMIERKAVGVRGNHEDWLISWASGSGFDQAAMGLGAEATLTSYGSVGRDAMEVSAEASLVPPEHLAWLESLGIVLDLRVGRDAYWVIHAGIPTGIPFIGLEPEAIVPYLVRHHAHDLLWAFTPPEEMPPVDRPVIVGHRIVRHPIDCGHVLAIDTGCGTTREGYLCAVVLPERRFIDSR
jgi:serine/threonine protein phosphatase 1